MNVGDLVRMRTHSLKDKFGVGLVVSQVQTPAGTCGFRVLWSNYGMGNRVARHSLEKVYESR